MKPVIKLTPVQRQMLHIELTRWRDHPKRKKHINFKTFVKRLEEILIFDESKVKHISEVNLQAIKTDILTDFLLVKVDPDRTLVFPQTERALKFMQMKVVKSVQYVAEWHPFARSLNDTANSLMLDGFSVRLHVK